MDTGAGGTLVSSYLQTVKIAESDNWSDYRVIADIAVNTTQAYPALLFRMGSSQYSARLLAVNSTVNGRFNEDATNQFAVATNPSGIAWPLNSFKTFDILAEGNHIVWKLDNKVLKDVELDTCMTGGVGFTNRYLGKITIDNIRVVDLGIGYTVDNVKNIDTKNGELNVTFDRAMNQNTFTKDNVFVKDSDGYVLTGVKVSVVDGTTMKILLPDYLESKQTYTVILSSDISSEAGTKLSCDKSFTFVTDIDEIAVENMKLYTADEEVTDVIEKGKTYYASADITNNTNKNRDFTVVMAIYKNDVLVKVVSESKTISKGSDTITTKGYTLKDEEGYSINVIMVDNLNNIRPLTRNKKYLSESNVIYVSASANSADADGSETAPFFQFSQQ